MKFNCLDPTSLLPFISAGERCTRYLIPSDAYWTRADMTLMQSVPISTRTFALCGVMTMHGIMQDFV